MENSLGVSIIAYRKFFCVLLSKTKKTLANLTKTKRNVPEILF